MDVKMEKKNNGTELKKQLSPMHVWAIAFGCIIGWGSFINPGKKFLPNSGVAGTAIAMVLQLVPIPGLSGVHFCRESYMVLAVWVVLGLIFYISRRKKI